MIQFSIKNILAIHHDKKITWFRILGYGLAFSKKPNFSQRNINNTKILSQYIEILKP